MSKEIERPPVVFMFQPTEFSVVPSDKLDEWERNMRERVGLKSTLVRGSGTVTESKCPDADDCDED